MDISPEISLGRKLITKYRKSLLALMGIPLTGKTTLGNELARQTNFVFLDVDVARRRIFTPRARSILPKPLESFEMLKSYQANHEYARTLLDRGQPVILGATYSKEIYHDMIRWLAAKTDSPLRTFLLDAPDEVLEKRLRKRLIEGSLSNVRTMEHVLADRRKYKPIEGVARTLMNTALPLQDCINQILDNLSDLRA